MHSTLVSMFNKIEKLHGSRTKQASNIIIYVKKDLRVDHVFFLTVTGFKKSRNFVSTQRTCVAKFIGSIIG